jgi:hypothetical protein
MAGYGSEGEGWWEDIVKVFSDETAAELYELEIEELSEKHRLANYVDDVIREQLEKLHGNYQPGNDYFVQEHEVN